MNISSVFNSGVEGFQRATEDANRAALEIASAEQFNSPSSDPTSIENQPSSLNENRGQNLTQSIVDLKVAEQQAKASANVIETADEVLGTLLDVRV